MVLQAAMYGRPDGRAPFCSRGSGLSAREDLEGLDEVCRVRSLDGQRLSGLRMHEGNGKGMQCGAGNNLGRRCSVERIAQEGEAQRGGVGANLMSASGQRLRLNEGVLSESLPDQECGCGRLTSPRIDGGAMLVSHVASQGQVRGSILPARKTVDNRMIDLAGLMPLDLHPQGSMGFGGARNHQYAGRHLVEAVHHPEVPVVHPKLLEDV